MTHYYVTNIAGTPTRDKNLEVTMHNSNEKTIAFNTPPTFPTLPCDITVDVSYADTKPNDPNINPINAGQIFHLIKLYGPTKYGY